MTLGRAMLPHHKGIVVALSLPGVGRDPGWYGGAAGELAWTRKPGLQSRSFTCPSHMVCGGGVAGVLPRASARKPRLYIFYCMLPCNTFRSDIIGIMHLMTELWRRVKKLMCQSESLSLTIWKYIINITAQRHDHLPEKPLPSKTSSWKFWNYRIIS